MFSFYTVWFKKVRPLPTYLLNRVKLASEIRFFLKLKCETSTIILSLGVKYSMRDLICEVNNTVLLCVISKLPT